MHFTKFLILRFSKRYSFNSKFHQNSIKLHTKYQKLWHLKFFLTHNHMELEILKRYFSNTFLRIPSKLYEDIAYHKGMQTITFLAIVQILQNVWHFEILTWESMGKPKLWNISKTRWADRRANKQKFGTRGTTVHMWRVLLVFDCLSLVWGHSAHFAKFPVSHFLKLYSSNFIQTLYKVS